MKNSIWQADHICLEAGNKFLTLVISKKLKEEVIFQENQHYFSIIGYSQRSKELFLDFMIQFNYSWRNIQGCAL